MSRLSHLIDQASFAPNVRLQIAACDCEGTVEEAAFGTRSDKSPVRSADRFYAASLAKQVTGAAAAILVKEGHLDPDLPVARYLSGLPFWAERIAITHLVHHTSGLPAAGVMESDWEDWTESFALAALEGLRDLVFEPGAAYLYSNLGYVLLARVIGQVAGCPFPRFVKDRLFWPLGLTAMEFTSGDTVEFAEAGLTSKSRPLTTGDGGLWSTASEFSRWLHHQNRDELGISELVSSPGRLTNGDFVAYGWGLGLRNRDKRALFVHGGQWHGCAAKAVRCPSAGVAIAAMSIGTSIAELSALVDAALEECVRTRRTRLPNT